MSERKLEISNSKDMTIVFIGFDGYCDLWNDCFELFNRFWPDCPYDILFVNNSKDVSYKNVKTLHAGEDAEWSRKVQIALQNCDTQYICLLLEDFFVGDTIDNKSISKMVRFIKKEKMLYYKLVNMSRAVKNRDPQYKGYSFLHVIPESDEYGVSLQAAIWDKDYLTQKIGHGNYNAWKFEFDRVKESDMNNHAPRVGCVFDDRNVLKLRHGVVQSKYIPSTVAYFHRIGYNLNLQRECLSYIQYYKIQFSSLVKYLLPQSARGKVKRFAEHLGMKFVSTTRDCEDSRTD